ncbi:MAG: exosortase family protein XrtG [Lachnospira sp.]|nr:exosortase family protein XrtG [Lachnospira sp.]
MNPIFVVIVIALWLYALNVLNRAKLGFWRYLCGSMGMFVIMLVTLRDILIIPMARCVAAMAGVIGNITDTFTPYLKYGIIFIDTTMGSMTLQIDLECSGLIEIMAFVSLLTFFRVYTVYERIIVGVLGTAYIMVSNALRITLICEAVHFFGNDAYYVSHTFIGRIFFYVLTVILYFYVFTKPHIIQMKVGNFSYGDNKPTA